MGRFEEDTSTMRMRIAATPIGLRKPELYPQSRPRGIATGVLLGAIMWAAIMTLVVAVWRWITN
jgi:hypothetical protein